MTEILRPLEFALVFGADCQFEMTFAGVVNQYNMKITTSSIVGLKQRLFESERNRAVGGEEFCDASILIYGNSAQNISEHAILRQFLRQV